MTDRLAGLRGFIQRRRTAKERGLTLRDVARIGVENGVRFKLDAEDQRPYIWITPARQGGAPCIGETRVPATQVANLIRHGVPIDEAASDYSVTRDDAICAVWWFLDGDREDRRTKLGKWLHAAHRYLADPSHNPDPGEFPKAAI